MFRGSKLSRLYSNVKLVLRIKQRRCHNGSLPSACATFSSASRLNDSLDSIKQQQHNGKHGNDLPAARDSFA